MNESCQDTKATSRDRSSTEITIDHGLAQVKPACADALVPLLRYDELGFHSTGGHLRHERRTKSAYELKPDDRLIFPTGCVDRVLRELERLGHPVKIRDLRGLAGDVYRVDEEYVAEAEEAFPGLAAAIRGNVQGVVEVARSSKRGDVIGHITLLLHKPRIFIACSTLDCVNRVGAALGPYVGGNVDVVRGGNWRSPGRVVCGTYKSLDHSERADWPVLIFEDAFEAMGRATHDALGQYGRNRVYALADPHRGRSPKDDLLLEILAGPVIRTVATGAPQPRMAVVLATYASPSRERPCEPRDRKRQLWSHEERNRAVAGVAQALAEGDEAALWNHGLCLDDRDEQAPLPDKANVVVLVESPEHGEHLARLLPGWHLLHAEQRRGHQSVPLLETAHTLGVPPKSIITTVYAAACPCFHANVLVMASGGPWPQIPTAMAKAHGPVVIVDFADDAHPSLVAETRERIKVYEDLGCRIAERPRWLSAEPGAVDPFPQQKPLRRSRRRQQNTSRRQSRLHRR